MTKQGPFPQYLRIPCETIGTSQWWIHESHPPHHNLWIWGFFPDIGNEDDGYGFIGIVYWDVVRREYIDRNGPCRIWPLMWCEINEPIVPIRHPTLDGARDNALARVTKPAKL